MTDPTEHPSDTTTTNIESKASINPTTIINEITMSDLDNKNNNNSANEDQQATTLFSEITRPDPLPTDLFQSSLAQSKLPISSTIPIQANHLKPSQAMQLANPNQPSQTISC
ncbi:hypothetical protein PPL_12196 [Heterostelium album PN500]|uniref:Uncharacterized protein n=1 Tax=Heterostelium pallidum (strain ATCC 26659 / Pp 5 / PN500) TaxID=670386 RepID=D3BLZ0_HETP5|nr:hypothetical protein PPL_12196 [Heterostelium album PN500]EFA77591.1 hypothetical protein PPL_12196 [Heterostelium album PN500]|eukprot:XP_020429719.1 hypothetical protein PPL_12196 [Heterostelium album PN500]